MGKKATYTILSMMKDEGHSLIEWVAYHRHIGFDNICVYTNNCNDGTDDMLIRLEELGYCHHFRNDVPEGKKPQPNALALASKNKQVTNSEWVLTMDADEFLSIKCGRGWVQNLIDAVPDDTDAVAVTWRFFGSNGITDWNPGSVVESYTHAAPDIFKKGWGVKTMFRPYENMKFGIHRPHIKKAKQDPEMAKQMLAQKWVNGSGKPMPDDFSLSGWRSTKPTLGYKLVELNHYGVKSYEAYLLRRIRGNVNNKAGKYDGAYFALFDRNEEEHTNALRHMKATKRLMAKMLEDEKLSALYQAALAYHKGRVEILHNTGEYDKWLIELKKAGETPIDKLDEILFTQHLPKIWQQKVQQMLDAGVPAKTIALLIARSQTARKSETREAMRAAAEGREVAQNKPTSAEAADAVDPTVLAEADAALEAARAAKETPKSASTSTAPAPNVKPRVAPKIAAQPEVRKIPKSAAEHVAATAKEAAATKAKRTIKVMAAPKSAPKTAKQDTKG